MPVIFVHLIFATRAPTIIANSFGISILAPGMYSPDIPVNKHVSTPRMSITSEHLFVKGKAAQSDRFYKKLRQNDLTIK